jgi:hypothetical protein
MDNQCKSKPSQQCGRFHQGITAVARAKRERWGYFFSCVDGKHLAKLGIASLISSHGGDSRRGSTGAESAEQILPSQLRSSSTHL